MLKAHGLNIGLNPNIQLVPAGIKLNAVHYVERVKADCVLPLENTA